MTSLVMALSKSTSTLKELQEELSSLSPEEIQQLKEKIGLKVFRQIFNQCDDGSIKISGPQKRENKNRPTEISSKRKRRGVPQIVEVKKRVIRDPRFDDLSGQFREEIFNRDYEFVSEIRDKEKKKVQKALKKEKNEKKKEKLKQVLNRMLQEEKVKEEKKKKKELINQWKEKEKERVKDGKKPYFLKKADVRKLELVEKFKTLKEKGLLESAIEKRRKRTTSRQRKKFAAT